MNNLDKIVIGFNAPYAVINTLAPKQAWEPIMPGLFDGGKTGDGAEKLCRFCGVISAASTAATYVVAKSGNDELKKQMRVINGATMIGSAACLSQFDEDKDFNNSSFAKPFKYGNMALQIGIGAALLKDGLGK